MIFGVPGAPQRGQGWHRRIYQAIERHDHSAARQAMREHMKQVAEDAQRIGAARI
jgi:DNA-binding FadR family transcriptional regulator